MDARTHRDEGHQTQRYEVIGDACMGIGELASLLEAAGYCERAGHLAAALVDHALGAYTFVAHARDADGRLAGYVGAFSDGAFATFVATLVVHPDARPHGVTEALVRMVQRHCAAGPLAVRAPLDVRRTG
jgi:ribosomal protein S18 acetylase RimI-like enzyme